MDPAPAPAVSAAAGKALDEKQQRNRSVHDDTTAAFMWAFILPDIMAVVLRFLPCLADRAAVRSVCRHWRAAARGHNIPPPLPLLVLPRLRFFGFSTKAAIVALRRWWMPEEVATGDVDCVGSSEGWLLMARPCEDGAWSERFLVNAFSGEVVHLPRLIAPYCTTSGEHPWTVNDDPKYSRSLDHVVLSAPPGSATKCIVAGFSYRRIVPGLSDWPGFPGITLWQPGMKTWYVYQSRWVDCLSDLVFHKGKLYMLHRSRYGNQSPWLFVFTLGEDEHGVNVSHREGPVTIRPFPCPSDYTHRLACYNLVQWHGSLVVIVRYADANMSFFQTEKVDVFALDLSVDPCGVTEIHSIGGDCVFVDPCRCTSFPAGSYEDVQGDCIYFIDKCYKYNDHSFVTSYVTTVYNMGDGTVKPFAAELLSGIPTADPVWMFPSE